MVILPILLIAIIILLGFIGNLIFKKTDIPNAVWLMGFGLLVGPVLELVDATLMQSVSEFFAALAVIIILFEGGINMELYKLFKQAPRSLFLAVSAFTLTVVITMVLSMIVGFDPLVGALLGVIIGGVSSPIVIPIVSKIGGISENTQLILAIESAVTDALCIVVAIALMETLTVGGNNIAVGFQWIASAFSVGAMIGLAVGIAWVPIMHRLEKFEYAYVVTLAMLLLSYAASEWLGGSGAIACLTFGVVLANGKEIFDIIKYRKMAFQMGGTTREFHSLIAFLVRTFFFVYLGLLVTIQNISFILFGVILSIAVLGVRPISVLAATHKTNFSERDKQVMSIMLPRGLAAAVLANLPASRGIAGTSAFPDIVFTVILATIIITTIGVFVIERGRKKEDAQKEAEKALAEAFVEGNDKKSTEKKPKKANSPSPKQ
ncbi:MAG: cation:proton antiporter [Candidatus Diapherotrites archaeon]|nr:cation:proton antiporter [Candidatus Diapherotrites archaeon]